MITRAPPNHPLEVRSGSLKLSCLRSDRGGEQRTMCEGRHVPRTWFVDNGISVPGQCLPPRCRAERMVPWLATDQ